MNEYDATEIAFKNGYKQGRAEVAREIFEDIDKQIAFFRMYMFLNSGVRAIVNVLAGLKKKYTEEGK